MRGSRFARAAATRLYSPCAERYAVQAMLQRMEVRERERLADDERRHQLELEEQRKRKVSTHNRVSSNRPARLGVAPVESRALLLSALGN